MPRRAGGKEPPRHPARLRPWPVPPADRGPARTAARHGEGLDPARPAVLARVPRMTEEERNDLAAEYVLGTLEAREAARVAAMLDHDAGLAEAVASWEARLAPLQALAPP